MTVHDSYLGAAAETVYGTAVAPARYFEMVSEGFAGKYERIESEAFRAGQRVLHVDRFQPNPKGAEGELKLEVLDKGFGLLFGHMLGTISLGTPVGGYTPMTATVGDLQGKSLTFQVGRVDSEGDLHPFTYEGGKVKGWELSNGVDGVLQLNLEMDFEKETIGGSSIYGVHTPTYAADSQLFTFVGGSVEIEGTPFAVSEIAFKGENGLKTDRFMSTGKLEPLEEGLREFTYELKGEFTGLSHANRIAAALASGAMASLEASWTSPQGGLLTVTIENARFDEGPVNFDGAQIMEQALKGKALWDGSTSPITVVYSTEDVAA